MQAAVVGLSARFNVMEILEKRVRSRFSHRRDLILEIDAAHFDHEQDGVPALLSAMLTLPVRSAASPLAHPFCIPKPLCIALDVGMS
jgi:hypothetical protein